ncbi:MAG: PQQ-binding-like beta-propeller repeat protein [Acidobacteria bacterium]|nr:PQQ-binding-like beta-propeller repeat protein [Acidobacteriota bacterium]MCW5970672.1 PQQ-binding-like beta-propeller repeat protein [Blastocatellales bacterium]
MIHSTRRISAFVFLSFVFFQSACSGRDAAPQESPRTNTVNGGVVALPNSSVVVVSGGKVRAWEPNGQSGWSLDLPDGDRAVAPPAAAPNSVVYIRGAQALYAVSPEGKMLWQAKYADDAAHIKNIVALSDSSAALVTGDTTVVCYATSGEVHWIYTLPDGDRLIAAPAAAPNGLLHLRGRNRLYAVNAEGKWQWQVDAQ